MTRILKGIAHSDKLRESYHPTQLCGAFVSFSLTVLAYLLCDMINNAVTVPDMCIFMEPELIQWILSSSRICHRKAKTPELTKKTPPLKHLSLKKLCWSWNKHLAVNSVCSSHGNLQFQLSLTVLVWRGGVWEKGNCDFNKFPHLWDNKRILFFISAYEWRNSSDGDLQSWHENTSSTQLPLPQKTLLLHSLKRLVWSRDFTSVTYLHQCVTDVI